MNPTKPTSGGNGPEPDTCWAAAGDRGPCWGQVQVIDSMGDDPDGSELWIYSCQAHREMWRGGTALDVGGPELYVPEK